jgi:collagenase-like PrtC family protease
MKLTLGPLLYNWPAEQRRDFYFRIADEAPYDAVHVGEVVCSKRQIFLEPYLDQILERLSAAGKQVILSSLALVTSRQERQSATGMAEAADSWLVEANDISIAAALAGRAFTVGPMVNVYNEGTLRHLIGIGATRICLPAELPAKAIRALSQVGGVEIEVQVFGRMPLAISSRCYHARLHNLHKDGCQFVCGQDPDGLTVDTIDGKPFLAINGTQTLSHRYALLLNEIPGLGATHVRLSPHSCDMVAAAIIYREFLDASIDAGMAAARLARLAPAAEFANGFAHGREGAALIGEIFSPA